MSLEINRNQPLHQTQPTQLNVPQQVHDQLQLPNGLTRLPRTFGDVNAQRQQVLGDQTQGLRGRTGTTGVSQFFKNVGAKLKGWFARPQTLAQRQGTFNVNLGGQTITLDSRILPMKLPRGADVNQIIANVQQKVTDGEQTYRDIVSGTKQPPCSTKDMTDLSWFMHVKSEAKKGSSFRDYAMNLPDPNGRLQTFLDSHPKAYQRESSHINFFQRLAGGTHRGIDARGTNPTRLDDVLPYGLKTMLYGRLSASPERKLPEDRLYIKLECHGCPSMNRTILRARRTPYDTQGPQGNFRRSWADFKDTVKHLCNFMIGNPRLPNGVRPLTEHKERLPTAMTNTFKGLVEQSRGCNSPQLTQLLTSGNPTDKSSGVRVMYANARETLAHIRTQGLTGNGIDQLAGRLEDFIGTVDATPGMDHINVRFGNEVIFDRTEMGLPH